ncbi:spore maturation protein [Porphyromonadaceae bacterium OttesenSCG-928-L07]|nr:spore maturation protein [Porphyromonadaceae bacterium OttesenSCG-928-L07]MDL2251423.1 spore maturation protein [Odoribacter sp. OttesenSCG-928-J03]MDL2282920.1 spore maturation protein [Odoribacter sp. OttesenSCG-928-G04]MDL2330886.1 spore maturation protein [Odoribacter sp. OttesenSCG-928-A06]
MVLNYIWIFFFIAAFIVALFKLVFDGDTEVFGEIVKSTFAMSKTGFEISLGLTGVLTLWMGIMKVGEKGGAITVLSKIIRPFFKRLFPEIPTNSPAYGYITMNIAANMLGLDNAATPVGLKAMQELQESNPKKDTASNAQIMFLVLNTSGLTLIPVSIMVYRAQLGAVNPADIFIPILLATYFSTLVGLITVAIWQKINLFNKVVMSYLLGGTLFICGIIWYFSTLDKETITVVSNVASNVILFSIIVSFITMAFIKKVNVYEAFIDGAKEGFSIAVKIIPYLVAILVAIGVFRASGAMDMLMNGVAGMVSALGFNTDFIPAMPTALMKPLSGSGARGLMVDAMTTYGADSFVGRLSCIFQGATDTTFYIIAVYFGAVGIKKTRYAVTCGLIADFAGIIAAIVMAYLFFA